VAEVAATASSSHVSALAGHALGWSFQARPFQCSISGPLECEPTAHALVAEVAATPISREPTGPGFDCTVHARPFQRSINAPLGRKPTAHAFEAEVAATPKNRDEPPGFGLAWILHARPSQCSTNVLVLPLPVK
jgi:hypothetical protein